MRAIRCVVQERIGERYSRGVGVPELGKGPVFGDSAYVDVERLVWGVARDGGRGVGRGRRVRDAERLKALG